MRKYERLRDETASDNIMNISFSKEREEYLQRAGKIFSKSMEIIWKKWEENLKGVGHQWLPFSD